MRVGKLVDDADADSVAVFGLEDVVAATVNADPLLELPLSSAKAVAVDLETSEVLVPKNCVQMMI